MRLIAGMGSAHCLEKRTEHYVSTKEILIQSLRKMSFACTTGCGTLSFMATLKKTNKKPEKKSNKHPDIRNKKE